MKIWLAHYDSAQPVDAAVRTKEAAQKVIEEMADEFGVFFPGDERPRWEHLAKIGYPNSWSYTTGTVGGIGQDYGQIQEIVLEDSDG